MSHNPDMIDPTADPSLLDEQLVAYLDGELDEETGREVEKLLTADPKLRRRIERLGKAWELLDELEQPQVGEVFTETTMELITVAAEDDLKSRQAAAPRQRRRQWLAAGGSLLATALAGFLAVALLRPDPDRHLLENLPVLENLDYYGQVGDMEFLRLLDKEGLFAEVPDDEP